MSTFTPDPFTGSRQRADGLWVPVVGDSCRAEIFNTEEAATRSAKSYVHKNWHRNPERQWEYAPPMNQCERCNG